MHKEFFTDEYYELFSSYSTGLGVCPIWPRHKAYSRRKLHRVSNGLITPCAGYSTGYVGQLPKHRALRRPPRTITQHTQTITGTVMQFFEPLGPLRQILVQFSQVPSGLRQVSAQLHLMQVRLHLVVVHPHPMQVRLRLTPARPHLVPVWLRQAPGQLPRMPDRLRRRWFFHCPRSSVHFIGIISTR
uniref:Uncharacterized protein n=1 Tax=Candidatus Kentrum sp. TC TaxID=2126339 RepID=A0A450ZRS8_9GAMM|nr:MAG: hypothetical protein BECKTC1821F_GA0114240_101046 [Candidatus Kentron sp. TC]